MVKKERILLPKPKSGFLLVQCNKCGNEQIIFSSTTLDIKCKNCETILAEKTGGKANINGTVLRRVD